MRGLIASVFSVMYSKKSGQNPKYSKCTRAVPANEGRLRQRRNAKCRCGSGKKFKACCYPVVGATWHPDPNRWNRND